MLGLRRALVVNGDDGLDEITITEPVVSLRFVTARFIPTRSHQKNSA